MKQGQLSDMNPWVLFFLVIFWSCLSMPEVYVVRPEDMSVSKHAVHLTLPEQHQSSIARERASRGQVRVLNYNFFLRSDLITDASTASNNDFKDERLEMLIERLDEYDILLLQEIWMTNSAGRKERLVSAARKRGFGYWLRSACRGSFVDGMLLILSRHPLVDSGEHT